MVDLFHKTAIGARALCLCRCSESHHYNALLRCTVSPLVSTALWEFPLHRTCAKNSMYNPMHSDVFISDVVRVLELEVILSILFLASVPLASWVRTSPSLYDA